jgi:hypothetical protein
MATYVVVHGGAHGGWCYRDVARLLRSGGHDVFAPTLTGCRRLIVGDTGPPAPAAGLTS